MAEPRAFVTGFPISHSRSPIIHRYWLKQHALRGNYDAVPVEPKDFASFLDRVRKGEFVGGNVTIPHKEQAFAGVDWRDEAAEAIGAVNTLWMDGGKLCGGNTDAYGFAADLDQSAPGWDKARTALVIGAGGAARAIVHALMARGFADIRIANRTQARAEDLAAHFGGPVTAHRLEGAADLATDAGLVVNTTSVGMKGEDGAPLDVAHLPSSAIVSDIVYVPLQTPLLADARRRGLKTVNGLGMLLHQAVPGFERWFGVRPEVTPELRALIEADVAAAR